MTIDALVRAVIRVEVVAAACMIVLLIVAGARRRAVERRRARVRALVQSLVASRITGSDAAAAPEARLSRAARRDALHEIAEYSRAVGGADRLALTRLAERFGLPRYVRSRSRSAFWWRRLEAARLVTQLRVTIHDVRRLMMDRHPLVRAQGATAAGAWRIEDTEPLLLAMLADPDEVCRFEAKQALVRMGAGGALAVLRALHEARAAGPASDSSGRMATLLAAAAAMPVPAMLPMALEFSRASAAKTRCAAAQLLAAVGGPESTRRLVELLRDDAPAVRCAAATAIGANAAWASAADLARLLGDDSYQVRLAAATALQHLGAPGTLMLRRAASSGSPPAAAIARQALDLVQHLTPASVS